MVIGRMPAVVSPAEPVKSVQRRRTSRMISDKPEGRDREVELRGAAHEEREHERDDARDDDRRDEADPERVGAEHLVACRPRGRVAADGGERRLRERELPRHPEDEVEADDEHAVEEPAC